MQRSKLGKNGDDATGAAGSPASVDGPRTLRNYGDTVCGIVDEPLSAAERQEVRRLASTNPPRRARTSTLSLDAVQTS